MAAVPRSDVDAMPARPGSFIVTAQGTRRLLNDELAKGLGTPNTANKNYPIRNPRRTQIVLSGFQLFFYFAAPVKVQDVFFRALEGLFGPFR
jgi:hypothetical protein